MSQSPLLPVDRFLRTLEIVAKEGRHLAYSQDRLYGQPIDATWVRDLENNLELAERLEAFVSRFGRIQDTIADKLLPRWLSALAEVPGSQIEVLNRAERLGVVESTERWLEARKLRNRLVHEYMTAEQAFAEDILLAQEYCAMFIDTFNCLRDFAATRMGVERETLPEAQVLRDRD